MITKSDAKDRDGAAWTSYVWFCTPAGREAFLAARDSLHGIGAGKEHGLELESGIGPGRPDQSEWRVMVTVRTGDADVFEPALLAHKAAYGLDKTHGLVDAPAEVAAPVALTPEQRDAFARSLTDAMRQAGA
jgi:hypothetical protein